MLEPILRRQIEQLGSQIDELHKTRQSRAAMLAVSIDILNRGDREIQAVESEVAKVFATRTLTLATTLRALLEIEIDTIDHHISQIVHQRAATTEQLRIAKFGPLLAT